MAKTDDKPAAKAAPVEAKPKDPTACVVDDGLPHVGKAVNGVVCSRHAMHYDRYGRRRGNG